MANGGMDKTESKEFGGMLTDIAILKKDVASLEGSQVEMNRQNLRTQELVIKIGGEIGEIRTMMDNGLGDRVAAILQRKVGRWFIKGVAVLIFGITGWWIKGSLGW